MYRRRTGVYEARAAVAAFAVLAMRLLLVRFLVVVFFFFVVDKFGGRFLKRRRKHKDGVDPR